MDTVPVVGGLHRHLIEPLFKRRQKLHHRLKLAWQLLLPDSLAILVHDTYHKVIAVQVDSCHYFFHVGRLSVLSVVVTVLLTNDNSLTGKEADLPTSKPQMFISASVKPRSCCRCPAGLE